MLENNSSLITALVLRRLLIIFLMLVSLTVNATEFDTAWIHTEKFSIYIEGDGGTGNGTVLVYIKEDESSREEKRYPFSEECTFKGHPDWPTPDSFSCHNNGHTPLAGTAYKLIKYKKPKSKPTGGCVPDDGIGLRYICIKGCGKSMAPKYLHAFEGMC